MADIKSTNFLENTTPPDTRNIFVGNEVDGEWERLTVAEFFSNFGINDFPIESDKFTPVFSNLTNVTINTSSISYIRVGLKWSITAWINLNITAAGTAQFTFTVPIGDPAGFDDQGVLQFSTRATNASNQQSGLTNGFMANDTYSISLPGSVIENSVVVGVTGTYSWIEF